MIKIISIAELYPHKNNPRKELGDLAELTESIKANGTGRFPGFVRGLRSLKMQMMKDLKFIVETYGGKAQTDVAIEECSELIKALLKHRRNPTAETRKNIIEEIADVEIMLNQLLIIYNGFFEVHDIIIQKTERQKQRIKRGE